MAQVLAEVVLWGRVVGVVAWDPARELGAFEYTPEFRESGIQLAPVVMPLSSQVYTFPELARASYKGLPGLLADSLPDKFGNLLIDAWLARTGRAKGSFSPVERLCYVGTRGMGALEFRPALDPQPETSEVLDVASLVELANEALAQREGLTTKLGPDPEALEAMRDILSVGTSAGGARAKAVIAWNEESNEVLSGQIQAPEGFGYWLLKFDGVHGNRDKELADPQGYGQIEFAYSQMAQQAGLVMSECRLLEENGRSHFMTRRFDRGPGGEKLFMQSLCALGHFDFNQASAYGYEQAVLLAQDLGLSRAEREQLFLRAVFNVMARNQDDHTKNIAFMMDKAGTWSLSPAYDVTYSYNPEGAWTSRHQMTLNGKREGFSRSDLRSFAKGLSLYKGSKLDAALEKIDAALGAWPDFAEAAGIEEVRAMAVAKNHRRLADLA